MVCFQSAPASVGRSLWNRSCNLRQSNQAGDCPVRNWHVNCQHSNCVQDSGGPMEPCVVLGSRLPHAERIYACMDWHARRHCSELCKHGWVNLNIVCVGWTRVGPRKHVLDGVHTGATWWIPLNRMCSGDEAFCEVTLTTCTLSSICVTCRLICSSKSAFRE